jgi:hypothetical protein
MAIFFADVQDVVLADCPRLDVMALKSSLDIDFAQTAHFVMSSMIWIKAAPSPW